MTQGAQADVNTVATFQLRLQSLCDEAAKNGVVLTVDIVALQPLKMGHYHMAPLARPQWFNSDR